MIALVAVVAWLAWRQAGHSVAEPGAPAPQAAGPSEVAAGTREGEGAGEGARASLLRSDDGPTLDDLRRDPDFRAGLASVTGRCVDPRGTPLHGLRVEVFSPEMVLAAGPGGLSACELMAAAATTDETGRFRIDGLHPGSMPSLVRASDGKRWVCR